MKRVAAGIYQLVTPFPEFQRGEAYRMRHELELSPRPLKALPYILPYLVVSRGEAMLVDCGWNTDDAYAALEEQLKELGLGVGDIGNLVLTHSHPDHCGMAGRLRAEAGCRVWMHEVEAQFMRSRYVAPEDLLERLRAWLLRHGVPFTQEEELERSSMPMRFFVAPVEYPDVALRGGETIEVGDFVFQVIWTPGHSPGHVCLYEPNHRLLLSGDHILPVITPNVSLHPEQLDDPLANYLHSLERVASLPVDRLLPAHEWDVDWFQRRIQELWDHHQKRLEEMLEAVGHEGPVTAYEVARRIKWTTGPYDDLTPWMKRAALGETLAHLRYLVGQGRLKEMEMDGRVYFLAT